MLESGSWGHSVLQTPALVNVIIMNLGQNVCLDHLWVGFSQCYDTQVSITGPSWPSCYVMYLSPLMLSLTGENMCSSTD